MNDLSVEIASQSFDANLECPWTTGDKSISHRALFLAMLTPGATTIRRLNRGAAVTVLLDAVRQLGYAVDDGTDAVTIGPRPVDLTTARHEPPVLDLGGSSTAARLLIGVLAGLGVDAVITGDASLRARPFDWVVEPLRVLGADIEYVSQAKRLPVLLRPSRLHSGRVALTVTSAQARSAILLAAVPAGITVEVRQAPGSRDHTERMLRAAGAALHVKEDTTLLQPSTLAPLPCIDVPGDPSAAAYPAVAHALMRPQRTMTFHDLSLNPGRVGFFRLLDDMGIATTLAVKRHELGEPVGSVRVGPSSTLRAFVLRGRECVHAMIDELPLAAALATFATGRSVIHDANELTFKETDRIATTCELLHRFSIAAGRMADGLWVDGGRHGHPHVVDSHGDHRLAMTAATLALALRHPIRIAGGGYYRTSFPEFPSLMGRLGAVINDVPEPTEEVA